ncbi:MaoC family dehydratase N-terminal domain-containing protein [Ralstonia solanacearum]|uniref:MaoC family dehydratase N-terminal domain-containing protein n=1 Tax=Ralstonia solanacearum TaxID=305 RepID=A0AAE3NHB3_RALSL|nr:MaoC family dehydratase N-terminal domain-containing protein [Ralstonia solanacearum]MBB6583822.1 MaoC family dehydratase N-terminal domain-containing protein [Ralstonia solanacearum]MDB0521746.1 MaoC family dehydratase N-terminal domain-containing protein [Ralstonia solanacearum]
MDVDVLRQWIGRTEAFEDELAAFPMGALGATLDLGMPAVARGDAVPPLWHWLYFLQPAGQSELGDDGHPKRGGFLPPIPLPRRMWAGGRLRFHQPLRVGETASRHSRIVDVTAKTGRSGALAFVTVEHQYASVRGLAITEQHDIVYREAAAAGAPQPAPAMAPTDEEWSREIEAGPVLLFRFSALTFNGHRIHYDPDYCRDVEHYPGLIVHGPLLAVLLLDLVRRQLPTAAIRSFEFKGVRPTFAGQRFQVCGKRDATGTRIALWVRQDDGALAMTASAEID